MFHDVSPAVSHQSTEPPDDTRRNVAHPTLTASKISVWLLVDWDHVPPDVKFANLIRPSIVAVLVVAVVAVTVCAVMHDLQSTGHLACNVEASAAEPCDASQNKGDMPRQYESGSALPLHAAPHSCHPPIRPTAVKSWIVNPVFFPRTAQLRWQLDVCCIPVGTPALSNSHIAWSSVCALSAHSHAVEVVMVEVVSVRRCGGTLVSVLVVSVAVIVVLSVWVVIGGKWYTIEGICSGVKTAAVFPKRMIPVSKSMDAVVSALVGLRAEGGPAK